MDRLIKSQSKWWTCPKCKSHKTIYNLKAKCIHCPMCGRYFDLKDREVKGNQSMVDHSSHQVCE